MINNFNIRSSQLCIIYIKYSAILFLSNLQFNNYYLYNNIKLYFNILLINEEKKNAS